MPATRDTKTIITRARAIAAVDRITLCWSKADQEPLDALIAIVYTDESPVEPVL